MGDVTLRFFRFSGRQCQDNCDYGLARRRRESQERLKTGKKERGEKRNETPGALVDTRFFGRYEIGNRSCARMQMKP